MVGERERRGDGILFYSRNGEERGRKREKTEKKEGGKHGELWHGTRLLSSPHFLRKKEEGREKGYNPRLSVLIR